MNIIYNASSIPSALMFAALNEQDMLCRVFGECLHGDPLDREIGNLRDARGPADPKLFTYVRYNAELAGEWLREHSLGHIEPRHVQPLDSTQHMETLQESGAGVAEQVKAEHAAGF